MPPQGKALDFSYSLFKVRFLFSVSASHKMSFCEILRSSSIIFPLPLQQRLKKKNAEALWDACYFVSFVY